MVDLRAATTARLAEIRARLEAAWADEWSPDVKDPANILAPDSRHGRADVSAPIHYNPPPMFGLRVEADGPGFNDDGWRPEDGWCIECGDEFHYDDCGGYNPPCSCGLHCRPCHDAEERNSVYGDDDEDYEDNDR